MILITGSVGFIGFSLCQKLISKSFPVVGIDNLNSYYDVKLKKDRLQKLLDHSKAFDKKFFFFKGDLENKQFLDDIFIKFQPKIVFNLAAQAGVRFSLENPEAYIKSNVLGFTYLLECCRKYKVENFIYASSSSVYGGNKKMPFCESDSVDHPISIYAATKKSNELIAHTYSHLYKIPTTGLRFFTVYGPWGRPDMAPMIFAKSILSGKPIKIFNNGDMYRDFTYIDDVVEILQRLIKKPAEPEKEFQNISYDPSISWAPYRIFNIGNNNAIPLNRFIEILEFELGKKAIKNYLPMQPGDVKATCASTDLVESWIDYKPTISVREGVKHFVNWYKNYYKF